MRKADSALRLFRRVFSSLKLTIACLGLLMALVALCTLAQTDLGTYGAVEKFMRSPLVYWTPPGSNRAWPVLPGGGLVGAVLLVNLFVTQYNRTEADWRRAGLWLSHLGLILLFTGEFVTGLCAVETQMAIEEGRTRNYSESPRRSELAVVDASDPDFDEVYSVPEAVFRSRARIAHPRLPFALLVKRTYANSELERDPSPAALPSIATAGEGRSLRVVERPVDATEESPNQVSAFVEVIAGDRSLGTWLVSTLLERPQSFEYIGRTWRLAMRPERRYHPFTLTLKDFKHDIYPGTDIPRNYSSLVRLKDPERSEDRDVLIYMNNPLRYRGSTFYQASFGKGDTLSVLQVVENPGAPLPYAALAITVAGLLIHFLTRLWPLPKAAHAPAPSPQRLPA